MNTWQHWVNLVLAVWLLFSVYAFSGANLVTDVVITGIVMGILSLWGGLVGSTSDSRSESRIHSHA